MQTLSALIKDSCERLRAHSATPQLDVEILLSQVLARSRAELKAYPETKITAKQARLFSHLLKRRQAGEPVAYLVGHQPFWTLDLKVTPETLIPRPETELIVEWALAQFPAQRVLRVADLGTGSGAIALALAKERPLWQLDATDLSEAALKVAQFNAISHQVENVCFYQGMWCAALPVCEYALIVSNPPYIAQDDPHLAKLAYEPQAALVSDQQGLADIIKIAQQARHYLGAGGILLLEHGSLQQAAVIDKLQGCGYQHIQGHQDYACLPRFVSAQWRA